MRFPASASGSPSPAESGSRLQMRSAEILVRGSRGQRGGPFCERAAYFIVRLCVGRYLCYCMVKAVLLLLEPLRTWEQIAVAQRSVKAIFLAYVLPLLLVTSFVEAWGMIHWGDWRGDVLVIKKFDLSEAIGFQIVQMLVNLSLLFLGAKMLKNLGETFHGRHTYQQAFTAVAYGLGPFFTLRVLDAFPSVNPWVTYALGAILTTVVLYNGVPRTMMPDPPQAFGLYIMGSLLLALTAGLGRFLVVWLQQGRFQAFENVITNAVSTVLPAALRHWPAGQ